MACVVLVGRWAFVHKIVCTNVYFFVDVREGVLSNVKYKTSLSTIYRRCILQLRRIYLHTVNLNSSYGLT